MLPPENGLEFCFGIVRYLAIFPQLSREHISFCLVDGSSWRGQLAFVSADPSLFCSHVIPRQAHANVRPESTLVVVPTTSPHSIAAANATSATRSNTLRLRPAIVCAKRLHTTNRPVAAQTSNRDKWTPFGRCPEILASSPPMIPPPRNNCKYLIQLSIVTSIIGTAAHRRTQARRWA